jgi:peptide/nickel transport system ATP-binding protein
MAAVAEPVPATVAAAPPPTLAPAGQPLLEVADLRTWFFTRDGIVRAVDGVSFHVMPGETLAIVGESGCGKSVTALSILRLVAAPPGRIVSGMIALGGRNLLDLTEAEMRDVRGNDISMIFQEPMTSLNPVLSIGRQIAETLTLHQGLDRKVALDKAVEMLRLVHIPEPERRIQQYPHQLSGGMRQRIVGAIAISCEPKLLIADEPTTSLDVTIQAQYLNLLRELQREYGLALIFITHNLGIVAHMCDRVAVMYAGRLVEIGPVRRIFDAPAHPYTGALLESIPRLADARARLTAIDGQPPDLAALPGGCAFHPRCPKVEERCRREAPADVAVAEDHRARCWLAAR